MNNAANGNPAVISQSNTITVDNSAVISPIASPTLDIETVVDPTSTNLITGSVSSEITNVTDYTSLGAVDFHSSNLIIQGSITIRQAEDRIEPSNSDSFITITGNIGGSQSLDNIFIDNSMTIDSLVNCINTDRMAREIYFDIPSLV